jgi:hypothetical protein
MEDVMAKGQMRPSKEKRKPKADKNKKQKGGSAPQPAMGMMNKPGGSMPGKG